MEKLEEIKTEDLLGELGRRLPALLEKNLNRYKYRPDGLVDVINYVRVRKLKTKVGGIK